jgi:hypothetical protein
VNNEGRFIIASPPGRREKNFKSKCIMELMYKLGKLNLLDRASNKVYLGKDLIQSPRSVTYNIYYWNVDYEG